MNILNPEFDKVQSTYRASTEDVLYQLQEIKNAVSGGGGGGGATEENQTTQINNDASYFNTNLGVLMGILSQSYSLPTIDNRTQQIASCVLGWVNQNLSLSEETIIDCKVYGIKLNYMTLQITENPLFVGDLDVLATCSDQELHFTRVKIEDLKEITAHPYKLPPFNMQSSQVYRMDLKGINKIKFVPSGWVGGTNFLVTLHY